MSQYLLLLINIHSRSCIYYSSSLSGLKMSVLILYLCWIHNNSIMIRDVGSAFPLVPSQFLRIQNLSSSWVNPILINIKLTFHIHRSLFGDVSHVIVLILNLIINGIDRWNILLWNLSSVIPVRISSGCSLVQLDVIQFNLSNVRIRNSRYSFYDSFPVHVDLRMNVVVILNIHNFLILRVYSWGPFNKIISFHLIG